MQERQEQVLAQQRREPAQERELLLSCHKQPKQQRRSQQRVREICSFVNT